MIRRGGAPSGAAGGIANRGINNENFHNHSNTVSNFINKNRSLSSEDIFSNKILVKHMCDISSLFRWFATILLGASVIGMLSSVGVILLTSGLSGLTPQIGLSVSFALMALGLFFSNLALRPIEKKT